MDTTNSKQKLITNIVLITIFSLLFSIVVFYASTVFFTVVCNYESIDETVLAGFPLYIFVGEIFAIGFYMARRFFAKRNIVFHKRYYALMMIILSSLGIIFSIIVGAVIYKSFLDYRIFKGYPLVMLLINLVLCGFSIYLFVINNKKIKNEALVNSYKINAKHVFKSIGYVLILLYSLDRLGAFLLMPIYYSAFDSVYSLPYLIQCIIPITIFVFAFINKRFLFNRKFAIISFSSIIAYSLFSLIFLLVSAKNVSNLILNSFCIVQHLERLITFPIDIVLMYVISFGVPIFYIIHAIWIMPHKADTSK